MKIIAGLSALLVTTLLCLPDDVFARGFGGRPGAGGQPGGGGAHPNFGGGGQPGGGGAHPNFGGGGQPGGGGARPNFGGGSQPGGGGARPNFGGGGQPGSGAARPNFAGGGQPGGGGARPNFGTSTNHSPTFSHPTGGGSSRPNFGGGGQPAFANRPGAGGSGTLNPNIGGGGIRPGAGGSGTHDGLRPGGGDRPIIAGGGNRPGGDGSGTRDGYRIQPAYGDRGDYRNRFGGGGDRGGIGNETSIGDRTNIGQIGNNTVNNVNLTSNNIASNRPYYNDWQHGNWNNSGGGYANGWANGYANGSMNSGWGGYWNGAPGGYSGSAWYTSPVTWGLGAWAVGSVMYNSGYGSYSNPYYAGGGDTAAYYDYSQPITVVNQQPALGATAALAGADQDPAVADGSATTLSPEVQEGTSHMNLARAAFKDGDYAAASREIDLAVAALPNDAALHEFRALVFFATKDYKQAAATLYAVLSAGPGWDWTTMSSMYASVATYSEQLRDLEQYVRDNPSSADARFVVAYHYLTCSHTEAAKRQFREVLKLQPADQLSAQLLKMLGEDPAQETADQPPDAAEQPAERATPPAEIDATKIVGNWTAKRPDGMAFSLKLTPDSKFTWGSGKGAKMQEFGGTYSVDGAVLVLQRKDGAQMPGLVTLADNGFNFKLYGGQANDPGLDFKN